ncbi:MAG: ABC transporter ATP-binding protein [Bacteroidota bacterium]
MSREEVIKVTHLSKKFTLSSTSVGNGHSMGHELLALNDVSFSIGKGESVGIFGLNGSGKSTLLKVLSGITKPSTGSVEIQGRVASILDIGAGFHPELSGHENIFLNAQLMGFTRKEIESKYDEIVKFSGVERFINEPVKNYSNGMYLRLAFSIMAHLDFDIYLFDEVMHVGDAGFMLKTQQKIQALSESDRTVVIVSHNLNDLGNCDKLIELNSGSIKNITSQKDVLSKYIIESVKQNDIDIMTKEGAITSFQSNRPSAKVALQQVRLYQENNEAAFRSSLPLLAEISYEKLSDKDTLDVILVVSDSTGTIIFVSTPLIKGMMSDASDAGMYRAICELPADFFSTNIYSAGITFVKNAASLKNADLQATGAGELGTVFDQYGVVASYSKALYFSVEVSMNNFADLGRLKLPVGYLLPGFNWTYKQDTDKNNPGQ